MRLTLRTLLAYLDDVLEPNEAREIGQKINESQEAAELVAQVRESIRRRRIGAPELSGPGSGPDPNIVSEYLENVLAPGQVVEFEQLCRQSELHLAEVAACHKILTMVMGQPIDVSDDLRERMYALGSTKQEASYDATPATAPQMTSGMGSTRAGDFNDGLPEYLTRGKKTAKIWTALAVLLMGGVWGFLVFSDKSIWSTEPNEVVVLNEPEKISETGGVDQVAEAQAEAKPRTKQQAAQALAEKETPVMTAQNEEGTAKPISANPPPPPETKVAVASLPQPKIDSPKVMEKTSKEGSVSKSPPSAPVPDPPSATIPKGPQTPAVVGELTEGQLLVVAPTGINISQANDEQSWVTVEEGFIASGDAFAAPVPFTGTLNFQNDITIQLIEGSRIQRLPRSEKTDLRFTVHQGRVVVRRPKSSLKPRVVEIVIGGQVWKADFFEPGTELAIEVTLPQPEGRLKENETLPLKGGFAVTLGKLNLALDGHDSIELVISNRWISWPEAKGNFDLENVLEIPAWTRLSEARLTPARRQLAIAYSREFNEDDVLNSISPVVSDRRASISEFATQTMSLTGNYLEVVPALESDHEESRLTAIISLRQWLAMDPKNEQPLREEMERQMRPELIDTVVDLLWGFSKEEAQSPEVSKWIVENLGHEDLAVRELAHFYVMGFSGRKYGFHAQAPLPERIAAVRRWKDYLDREESLLQPEKPAP